MHTQVIITNINVPIKINETFNNNNHSLAANQRREHKPLTTGPRICLCRTMDCGAVRLESTIETGSSLSASNTKTNG